MSSLERTNQRGGRKGIIGGNREVSSRNMYKGHMDKAKGERIKSEKWGGVWHGGLVG